MRQWVVAFYHCNRYAVPYRDAHTSSVSNTGCDTYFFTNRHALADKYAATHEHCSTCERLRADGIVAACTDCYTNPTHTATRNTQRNATATPLLTPTWGPIPTPTATPTATLPPDATPNLLPTSTGEPPAGATSTPAGWRSQHTADAERTPPHRPPPLKPGRLPSRRL